MELRNDMLDLNKKQQLVLGVIQRNPRAANDDAVLLERYWIEVDGWGDTKSLYWNLSKSTRPETITRRRRELYNMGLIHYSDGSNRRRTDAFKNELDCHSAPLPGERSNLNSLEG